MKKICIFFILLFSIFSTAIQSQTLEDAKSWYLEGRFAESLPVFQTEYRNNPGNASINQWLGVSLYETGRISEAEKYLQFAAEKKIPEAYIYLGELYTKMYRFEEAEAEFAKYQRANRRNEEALSRLTTRREYAAKLQRLVNRTEDIQIIDSLVLPKSNFLLAYNLGKSSGSLLSLSDFFKTLQPSDKSLYMNGKQDKIFYSRSDDNSGIDLFTMDKLIDAFGNEKKLPQTINGEGDQAYPFVMSDGLTIYFASTGHESLGGYDLFVTRYNLSTDSYLAPNQLNMPFNSPFNDYLMVVDEEKGLGWFASDRFQSADSVCVYTFIPNPQVILLESDQPHINNRARITSIAETWKPGTDYVTLRETAKQKTDFRQEEKSDFLFVINDSTDYHTLSDFRSNNARSIFSQALGLEEQLQRLTDDLTAKRELYANGNNNESLRTSILGTEQETDILFGEIQRLRREARNEELRARK